MAEPNITLEVQGDRARLDLYEGASENLVSAIVSQLRPFEVEMTSGTLEPINLSALAESFGEAEPSLPSGDEEADGGETHPPPNPLNGAVEMEFQGGHGLSSELSGFFNTFRCGHKWASLRPGAVVDLRRTTGDHVGYGAVVEVRTGRLSELAISHASLNHSVRNMASTQTQQASLLDVLESVYGAEATEGSVEYTVVYMVRLIPSAE